jgi:uncharacterized protein YdaT
MKKPRNNKISKKVRKMALELVRIKEQSNRVHVISRENSWAVKVEGAKRASRIYPNKIDAIVRAKELRDSKKLYAVVVHKKDGTVEKWLKAEQT